MLYKKITDRAVNTIGIIGFGVIGSGWTVFYAMLGFNIIVIDNKKISRLQLSNILKKKCRVFKKENKFINDIISKIKIVSTLEELSEADLIHENIIEVEKEKAHLFKTLDELIKKDVVIASSTSSLSISKLQQHCPFHPERFIVAHPFNPVYLIPLVEIAGSNKTDEDILKNSITFFDSLGKIPIRISKEVPGFIVNRLQAALLREIFYLLENEITTAKDIDSCFEYCLGQRWATLGPCSSFMLAGGEKGISGALEHFSEPLNNLWKTLGSAKLDKQAKTIIKKKINEMPTAKKGSSLEVMRDLALYKLFLLKNKK